MSASSTPTVRPRAASAAARLTVTDDLPTPPLPEPMATTRVVGADGGLLLALGDVEPGPLHGPPLALGVELGPLDARPSLTPGRDPTRARTSALELGPQRAAGGGEGDGDDGGAVGAHLGRGHHAQLDDVAAQLGVDHPAQRLHDVVGRWVAAGTHGFYRSSPSKLGRVEHGRTARPAQGARRQHPLRHLPRAGPLARRRSRRPRWPRPSACTSTRCGPRWSGCARSGCSRSTADHRGAPGRPQHRYSRRPRRPVARPRAADLPDAGPDAASASPPAPGPPATTPSPPATSRASARRRPRRGARRPAVRRRRRRPARPPRASTPRPSTTGDGVTTVAFARCPFRDAGRGATPSWCAACTGAWSRGSSTADGGEVAVDRLRHPRSTAILAGCSSRGDPGSLWRP